MDKSLEIIGVPSDLGGNMRGTNIGPAVLRIAGLQEKLTSLGYTVIDSGDVRVPVRETLPPSSVKNKFSGEIQEICFTVKERVFRAMTAGRVPVVLGGDHSLAIGSVTGVRQYYDSIGANFGLIWVDAHGDLNTPKTSTTGNVHGMPLATLLGQIPEALSILNPISGKKEKVLNPANVALVGIRALDQEEKDILRQTGIRYFTMREIDERGMFEVMKEAIAIAKKGTRGIHLSFDIDAVDPVYAPAVTVPAPGGLSYREAHLALELIADQRCLTSMEFVELNPIMDTRHHTADLIIELIQSALGKSIV